MVGQGLWCLAHTLWMGNSFVLVASLFLMGHHLFGCVWVDRRVGVDWIAPTDRPTHNYYYHHHKRFRLGAGTATGGCGTSTERRCSRRSRSRPPCCPSRPSSRCVAVACRNILWSFFGGVSNQTQSNVTTSNNPNQNKTKFSTQGRQELPADYWKEFARLPYLIIGVGTLGAYLLHPFMQAGSWVVRG